MTSSAPLVVIITTSGGTLIAGQSHRLTCEVSGGDTTIMTTSYQWLKNDQIINDQTSSTLSFSPLSEADTGQYNCRGTRGSSTDTSNTVVITVNGELQQLPNCTDSIMIQSYLIVPSFSVTITSSGQPTEGQRYVLTCYINGIDQSLSASITYQWDRVGSNFSPSTSQQLIFNPLRYSDGGQYRCTVTISSPYLTGTHRPTNVETIIVPIWSFLPSVRPDPVSDLTVTAHTATSITITWTVSSTTVIPITDFEITYNYTVRRCSAPISGSHRDSISDGTRRSHTLSGLNEDSDYIITVRAINVIVSSIATTTRGTTDTSGITTYMALAIATYVCTC